MKKLRMLAALTAVLLVALAIPAPFAGAAPAAPTITGAPDATVGTGYASFTFFSPGATSYQCRVFTTSTAGGAFGPCTGSTQGYHQTAALADGNWTFEVRAVDGSGTSSATVRNWVVTSDPIVQWIVEPNLNYTSRFVNATFTAPGATSFQCRLNGSPAGWGSCSGSSGQQGMWQSAELADGSYTLEVRAQDAGGPGPVATAQFTVGGGLPITWISKPEGNFTSRFVTATFTAREVSSFQCRLNPVAATAWGSCPGTSGQQGIWQSGELADGSYTLEVRAVDGSNLGPVETATFTVGEGLELSWVSRPTGNFTSRYVTATFTAPEVSGFQCRLNPVAATAWGSCSGTSGQQGMWQSGELADGAYTLEVRAIDGSNFGPAVSTTFTVAGGLATTWTAKPEGTLTGAFATATFAAPGATNFQCRLNGTPASWGSCNGTSGQQGMWQSAQLANGSYTLEVRATSGSNIGPVLSTTFSVALATGTSTDVSFVSGPAEGSTIVSSWAALSWSAPGAQCYRFELDGPDADLGSNTGGGSVSACGTAQYYQSQTFVNLTDGPHVLRVQTQSTGGSYGPVLARNFTVASGAVTSLSFVSGPAEGSTIVSSWAALSWSAPGAQCYRFELDGPDADLGSNTGGGSVSACGTAQYYQSQTFVNLTDGPHVLRVQTQSTGGTYGPVLARNFTVASGAVTSLSFVSGPAEGSTIVSSWAALSWSAPGAQCYRFELDGPDADLGSNTGGGSVSACGTAQYYQSQTFVNLTDGPHVLRVQAQSTGGSYGPVLARNFTVASGAVTSLSFVSGPAEGSTIVSSWAALSWSAPGAQCYRFELDGPDADLGSNTGGGSVSACGTAQYYQSQTFVNLTDGPHVLRVQAQSTGGSYGPVLARNFIVRAGPLVSVSSAPLTVLPSGVAALSWSAPGAQCYRFELDGPDADLGTNTGGGSVSACGTAQYYQSQTFTGLTDGPHLLRVQAQTTGGTYGPVTTETFTVETKAPDTTITVRPNANSNSATATFGFTADEAATFTCRIDGGSALPCSSPWVRPGLGDGPHSVEVTSTDLFGNVDPSPATWAWSIDTVAPTVVDLFGPPPVTGDPDAVLTFVASESASFECRLNGSVWSACSSPRSYPDQTDGAYLFEVRATDAAGNVSPIAPWNWVLDTDPPDTTITSGPATLVNTTSAAVAFTSPDSPVTFQCALDGAAFQACTSPWSATGLSQGVHVLEVRAVGAGGLTDPSPASRQWSVDTVAPIATIDSGPSGTVGIGASTFTFSANETASFTCSLDGSPAVACASPDALGALGAGSHTFTVAATDTAGNLGPAASRNWTVDATAPVVTLTGGPVALTNATGATVTFTVDDPTATAACSLDGAAFVPCTSPVVRTGLGNGAHSVAVRATDPAGNVSATQTRNWTVDTVAPIVTITGGSASTSASTTGTVTFTVDDPGATPQCSLDGGAFATCTSPASFAGLSQGAHDVRVRAVDAAGNTGPIVTRSFTVDTVAPVVTITGGPTGTVSTINASVTFTVDDPSATTECRLDGGAWSACTSPKSFTGLGNGPHLAEVRATDTVGNVGTPAERPWTVLTLEPETTITSGPAALSNTTAATISFTSNIVGAEFRCALDSGPFTLCTSPSTLTGLGQGDHTVRVRAESEGLQDPTPASITWTVDTIAPVLDVTSAPNGTTTLEDSAFVFTVDDPSATTSCRVDGGTWVACATGFTPTVADGIHTVDIRAIDPASNTSAIDTTTWTVDDSRPMVQITSGPSGTITVRNGVFTFTVDDPTATVECRLDLGSWAPCTSPRTVTGLNDGLHSFDVRATDPAGNESAEGRSFFVDATGPSVIITGGPVGSTTATSATLTFTVDDPAAVVECSTDSGPWVSCTSPAALAGLAEGPHRFQVRATDTIGNIGLSAARLWTVDLTAPTVTITSGPSGVITVDEASFAFEANEVADFQCRLNTGAWVACTSPRAYQDLVPGTYTFEVRAIDAAGQTGPTASRAFTVQISGQPALGLTVAAQTTQGVSLLTTGLGDDFRFRTTVQNSGPVAAENVAVQIPLSSDLSLVNPLPAGCTSPDADGPVTCQLASVAAGGSRTIDLRVEATFDCTRWGDSGSNGQNGTAPVEGTSGNDIICGGGGADTINGRGGNDTVRGYGPRSGPGGPVTVGTGASATYGPGSLSGASPGTAVVAIAGADSGDTITTGTGSDTISSEEGGDTVVAGGGVDTILTGDGADAVDTGSGGGSVGTGAGNDNVLGGTGVDTIAGDGGVDQLSGGAGNDLLDGGTEGDIIDGGTGDDTIDGGSGSDGVRAGDGNDTVLPNAGSDAIDGGTGNDALYGGADNDNLLGGAGIDRLFAADGDDSADGGDAVDEVYGGEGRDTVRGGAGNDTVVNGQGGPDSVYGDDGSDVLVSGGRGADRVDGGTGNDEVFGNGQEDSLEADGIDAVFGGDGNDVLHGGDADDTVRGGLGNDRVDGEAGADLLYGDEGDDDLNGDVGNDRMWGGDGRDILIGFAGEDRLLGGEGHDYLDGSADNDYLNGQGGRDVLRGNAGNDELDGGAAPGSRFFFEYDHWNRLYGDAGAADICHFGPGSGAEMTNYRDGSCELRQSGLTVPGAGWLNGSRPRLDRGASNPVQFPG